MLSIQETVSKAETQLKAIETYMDDNGFYDPAACTQLLYAGLKRSIQREISETLRKASLKEFLYKSGTTGYGSAAGINYLIAPILSGKIYAGIDGEDKGPSIAADIIHEAQGETIYIPTTWQAAHEQGEAGEIVPTGMIVNRASTTYTKYRTALVADYDMMEDSQFSLMDYAAQQAGLALGRKTNDQICAVLKRTTGTTGLGTKQTASAGGDTTTPAEVGTITAQVASGGDTLFGTFTPNLLVCTPEALHDALSVTAGHPEITATTYGTMSLVQINSLQMGTVASNRLTNAVSIVMQKEFGLLIARKAWMRIENYSDPRNDLLGAVVTARQGCGELVDAAIGVLTEA